MKEQKDAAIRSHNTNESKFKKDQGGNDPKKTNGQVKKNDHKKGGGKKGSKRGGGKKN